MKPVGYNTQDELEMVFLDQQLSQAAQRLERIEDLLTQLIDLMEMDLPPDRIKLERALLEARLGRQSSLSSF